jgi:hypothetical protein
MDNNNLIIEINKLKELISTLQQQLQTQQNEIKLVKETVLKIDSNVRNHWHGMLDHRTEYTFFS